MARESQEPAALDTRGDQIEGWKVKRSIRRMQRRKHQTSLRGSSSSISAGSTSPAGTVFTDSSRTAATGGVHEHERIGRCLRAERLQLPGDVDALDPLSREQAPPPDQMGIEREAG